MEPVPHVNRPCPEPTGHWLKRGLLALAVERRLPYRVSVTLDKLCNFVGLRHKTVKANGLRLKVRRLTCDEQFVQNIIVDQDYTPPGFPIRETDTVIDIGGNIGTFALLASRYASRGRVFTFEPNGENYELLLQNIALSRVKNITPVRAAVAGRRGKVKLYCSSEGGYHSLLESRKEDPARYELVEAVSLRDIFVEHHIDRCNFLKLDCEGAEYDILYNLSQEYYARIDKIVMEYHGDDDKAKRRAAADALVRHLENVGFRIDTYTEFVASRGGFIRATLS